MAKLSHRSDPPVHPAVGVLPDGQSALKLAAAPRARHIAETDRSPKRYLKMELRKCGIRHSMHYAWIGSFLISSRVSNYRWTQIAAQPTATVRTADSES
jgi:hypothetical protein